MCDFFSGIITRNFEVLTDPNSNHHETMIEKHKLDDSIPVDDERRKWVRFEIVPTDLFSKARKDWVFRLDESIKPKWFNGAHEDACWDYVKRNLVGKPWLVSAGKEVARVRKIKWFKPMKEPDVDKIFPLAQKLGKAFKIRDKIKVKLIRLDGDATWGAARDATWGAAWDAARDAAWDAAWDAAGGATWDATWDAARAAAGAAEFEIGASHNKKYKTNPFRLLVDFWEKGFYCCGIRNNTLTLGYVPK